MDYERSRRANRAIARRIKISDRAIRSTILCRLSTTRFNIRLRFRERFVLSFRTVRSVFLTVRRNSRRIVVNGPRARAAITDSSDLRDCRDTGNQPRNRSRSIRFARRTRVTGSLYRYIPVRVEAAEKRRPNGGGSAGRARREYSHRNAVCGGGGRGMLIRPVHVPHGSYCLVVPRVGSDAAHT